MRSFLEDRVAPHEVADATLAASELVANSVRHADVTANANVGVEILIFADRLRLCVVDSGASETPRNVRRRPDEPGGLGLAIVERLSAAWGVARDARGVTRTWCDLALIDRE
jgi:anti-sigma regulatory factor (Ser/Thr protein kinase)